LLTPFDENQRAELRPKAVRRIAASYLLYGLEPISSVKIAPLMRMLNWCLPSLIRNRAGNQKLPGTYAGNESLMGIIMKPCEPHIAHYARTTPSSVCKTIDFLASAHSITGCWVSENRLVCAFLYQVNPKQLFRWIILLRPRFRVRYPFITADYIAVSRFCQRFVTVLISKRYSVSLCFLGPRDRLA
jgi:hypothetical protein